MQNVKITKLDNGLKILTKKIPNVDSVSLGYWIEVGSQNENAQNAGISHCLEHMVFKGTKERTCKAIAEEIESVGGYLNAYTSKEVTAYYAKVLREDIDVAIDITTDLTLNALCDGKELEKEKNVILQEISQTNDTPDDIIFDHFSATAYAGQRIGKPILGTIDSVKAITKAQLLEYKTLYTPDITNFCAAGDVEHDVFVQKVEKYYHKLSNEYDKSLKMPREKKYDFLSGNYSDVREIEQIHLIIGFESYNITHPNLLVSNLYSSILGAGMSSRLYQEIREKRGLVYSIYSGISAYKSTGTFYIYAATSVASAEELIDVTCAELQKIIDNISDEELKRNKAQHKANLLMSLENVSASCEQLAGHIISFDRHIPKAEILEKIEKITKEDVYEYAKNVLEKKVTLVSVGPEKSEKLYEKIGKNGLVVG